MDSVQYGNEHSKARSIPEGYRLAREGEILPEGKGAFKLQHLRADNWIDSDGSMGGHRYRWAFHRRAWRGIAVPIKSAKSAAPKKHRAPKPHTWTPYTLDVELKDTTFRILCRATDIMDAANQLGTENAKLKNQLAALRRKIKETK